MDIKFLKLQKIILWIPIINFLNFFLWAINCFRLFIKYSFLKSIPIVFVTELCIIACLGMEMLLFNWIFHEPYKAVLLLYYIEGITASFIFLQSQKYMSQIKL